MCEMRIAIVTSNAGKYATICDHFSGLPVDLEMVDMNIPEIQSADVGEIALAKAQSAFTKLQSPILVEDSGFYIDALRGYPGPYVKHVLQTVGIDGILKLMTGVKDRRCSFKSAVVFIGYDGMAHVFLDNSSVGSVAEKPGRLENVGWSELWRIFVPEAHSATLAEMSGNERGLLMKEWRRGSAFTAARRVIEASIHL